MPDMAGAGRYVSQRPAKMVVMPSEVSEAFPDASTAHPTSTARGVPLAELDDDQREAVQAPRGPVCVLAGAGTG